MSRSSDGGGAAGHMKLRISRFLAESTPIFRGPEGAKPKNFHLLEKKKGENSNQKSKVSGSFHQQCNRTHVGYTKISSINIVKEKFLFKALLFT